MSSARAAIFSLLLALCSVLAASRPVAAQSAGLSACIGKVVNAARGQGAKASAQKPVDFLLTGDEKSYDYVLPQAGCLGFLAVGQRNVLHLGLSLFTPGGGPLAQDAGRDAHAYARTCGAGGERVVVNVRMLDGEGEFQLVPLWNAPEELTALEPIMASCTNTGTARPTLVDVGPEPRGPELESSLVSIVRQLGALGYAPLTNTSLIGSLAERHRDLRRVSLDAGHCYALAAIGDAEVEDIDLRLVSLQGEGQLLASDTTRSREAIVKVCAEGEGQYALDVRMYRGGGTYLVQGFELPEPAHALPAGVEGESRTAYMELVARLRARGLRAVPIAWGVVGKESTQTLPVSLRPGRCYAVGVIASGDVGSGDLDLTLTDAQGTVLGAELGPSPNPLLYHCTRAEGAARAVVQSHQIRTPARFLLVVGEPEAEAPR